MGRYRERQRGRDRGHKDRSAESSIVGPGDLAHVRCLETTFSCTCWQENQNENSDTAGESPEDMSASFTICQQRGVPITHHKEAAWGKARDGEGNHYFSGPVLCVLLWAFSPSSLSC